MKMSEALANINWMPVVREARGAVRWRPQTSQYMQKKVAERSLHDTDEFKHMDEHAEYGERHVRSGADLIFVVGTGAEAYEVNYTLNQRKD